MRHGLRPWVWGLTCHGKVGADGSAAHGGDLTCIRWKEDPCSSRYTRPRTKIGAGKCWSRWIQSSSTPSISTPTARYGCASQWRLDTWSKVDSASAAQVPQEHEICWRRCRRNTNADCIAVSIEPSSVDLATMGAQMAVRSEPPWIRHSAPTGCTKQEWNATASLPPLLLLQDAWNPFQMKRGKGCLDGACAELPGAGSAPRRPISSAWG